MVSLAQLLGHENLNTTARYTKRSYDQLSDAMISLLINAALEFDGLEQWQAILQLEILGELAFPAVPALERLSGGDSTISKIASDAIHEITGNCATVIEVGLRLLKQPDWLDRVMGIEHLMQLDGKAKCAIPELEWAALRDEDEIVRNRAMAALEEIEGGE